MVVLAKNKSEFLKIFIDSPNIFPDVLLIDDAQLKIIFHPMIEILFLIITAMLAGAESWYDIVHFGLEHLTILKKYLPFEQGIPKVLVINRLFTLIDNKRCDKWLRNAIDLSLKNISSTKNNLNFIQFSEYACCGITKKGLSLKLPNDFQQYGSIISYVNFIDTIVIVNKLDVSFAVELNNKVINNGGLLAIRNDDGTNNSKEHGHDRDINNSFIEIQLMVENDAKKLQAANNMLMIREIMFDIIKKYKIKTGSKRGINAVRRLASNNQIMLIDILNNWIYSG